MAVGTLRYSAGGSQRGARPSFIHARIQHPCLIGAWLRRRRRARLRNSNLLADFGLSAIGNGLVVGPGRRACHGWHQRLAEKSFPTVGASDVTYGNSTTSNDLL